MHAHGPRSHVALHSSGAHCSIRHAAARYFALIERRAAGEPTQYITGKQEFWGLEFEVAPGVLIPRPETEHVMEVVLARLGERGMKIDMKTGAPRETLYVADVGTGSGCLAVALAYELPHARCSRRTFPATRSPDCTTKRRAAMEWPTACRFLEADLLAPFLTSGDSVHAMLSARIRRDREQSALHCGRRGSGALAARNARPRAAHGAFWRDRRASNFTGRLVEQAEELLKDARILVLELGHDSADYVRGLFDGQRGVDERRGHDRPGGHSASARGGARSLILRRVMSSIATGN